MIAFTSENDSLKNLQTLAQYINDSIYSKHTNFPTFTAIYTLYIKTQLSKRLIGYGNKMTVICQQ